MKELLLIIKSVLAAFCGIQSNKKFSEDDDYIQKNGVSSFILIGIHYAHLEGAIIGSAFIKFLEEKGVDRIESFIKTIKG